MGALTSKPYAFTARPWELRNVKTIDISDTECVPIRVQLKGNKILRVLPLLNNYTKSDWISDRTRFSYDGFYNQRITTINYINYFSMVGKKDNYKVEYFSWNLVLDFLVSFFRTNLVKFSFLVQKKLSVQELIILDKIASLRGESTSIFSQINETNSFSNDLVPLFTLPHAYQKLQQCGLVITIGLNLREQFPIFYTLLRQRFLSNGNFNYYYIMANTVQSHIDSDFGISLGNSLDPLWKILTGKHAISKNFLADQTPLILVGGIATLNYYFPNFMVSLLDYIHRLSKFIDIKPTVGLLTTDANHFGTHYYGIGLENCRRYWGSNNNKKYKNIPIKQVFMSGAISTKEMQTQTNSFAFFYNIGLGKSNPLAKTFDPLAIDFIIDHSSHHSLESGFTTSNLIIPDFSVFEKSGLYYNFTGFAQFTNVLVNINNIIDLHKPLSLDKVLKIIDSSNTNKEEIFFDSIAVVDSSNQLVDFSEILLNSTFTKNNVYNSQTWLKKFFFNPTSNYDYLLNDSLSINSPTLNLMKQINVRSQLNFVN